MTEREMEDLIWAYPEKFFHEPLKQLSRQQRSSIGRSDIIFVDRLGRILVVELKKGKLGREAIGQIVDYFGMMKKEFPDKPVELILVANSIPEERRLACDQYHVEAREIPEKKFRDVAEEVGYQFESESTATVQPVPAVITKVPSPPIRIRPGVLPDDYRLLGDFDRSELERLIGHFEGVVRRQIDRSPAQKLRNDLISQNPPQIALDTLKQLARWCNTNNPVYWDGMEVARKISVLLFGTIVDRNQLNT